MHRKETLTYNNMYVNVGKQFLKLYVRFMAEVWVSGGTRYAEKVLYKCGATENIAYHVTNEDVSFSSSVRICHHDKADNSWCLILRRKDTSGMVIASY